MEFNHLLSLPDWGPYTKKYMGISHISNKKRGMRFDFSAMPVLTTKDLELPDVMVNGNYHPWEAKCDLSSYTHRHELVWKDRVYCDITYQKIDDKSRLMICESVNNTEVKVDVTVQLMSNMSFPTVGDDKKTLIPYKVQLPEGAVWTDGRDYKDLKYHTPRPDDNLVADAKKRSEIIMSGFVNGFGIGDGFGEVGDTISYRINLENNINDAVMILRYQANENTIINLMGDINKEICLNSSTELVECNIPIGQLNKGKLNFDFIVKSSTDLKLDGFVLVSKVDVEKVSFEAQSTNFVPEIIKGDHSIILKYEDADLYYGIAFKHNKYRFREFYSSDLLEFTRRMMRELDKVTFTGQGEGHFTNIVLENIKIAPYEKQIITAYITSGTLDEVKSQISTYLNESEAVKEITSDASIFSNVNDSGKKYLNSQLRMAATTLTNVVYPIYRKGEYVKHYTPGRIWDCLYTWDSGFNGLGLMELDIKRAIECLDAYLTEPDDEHCAFIHHGSPVPVQAYLFLEIWNRTQSNELLEYCYPRLKRYYKFLSGTLGSSTTRDYKSNLLRPWDYFYNSGGWDDYPVQWYTYLNKLGKTVAPAVTTSQCIRFAKIMIMAAKALEMTEDLEEYKEDITIFSHALQKYSWDEKAGYFSYVTHDEEGNPSGILRHEDSGENFNMGLDGTYPLVAGVCTEKQKVIILGRLKSKDHLWSDVGISTVDKSAPYYSNFGYWNGSVWMPHQWFYWKTMLDLGEEDFAYKIAQTAIDVWKYEVDETYNCRELFKILTGRGFGWHHFSGLSTPVLSWFSSYFTMGKITCGFDIWIDQKNFSEDFTSLDAKITSYNNCDSSIVVSMNPKKLYEVLVNGQKGSFKQLGEGIYSIKVPKNSGSFCLEIK